MKQVSTSRPFYANPIPASLAAEVWLNALSNELGRAAATQIRSYAWKKNATETLPVGSRTQIIQHKRIRFHEALVDHAFAGVAQSKNHLQE